MRNVTCCSQKQWLRRLCNGAVKIIDQPRKPLASHSRNSTKSSVAGSLSRASRNSVILTCVARNSACAPARLPAVFAARFCAITFSARTTSALAAKLPAPANVLSAACASSLISLGAGPAGGTPPPSMTALESLGEGWSRNAAWSKETSNAAVVTCWALPSGDAFKGSAFRPCRHPEEKGVRRAAVPMTSSTAMAYRACRRLRLQPRRPDRREDARGRWLRR